MAITARKFLLLVALPLLGGTVAALNPSCAPGGNFDLSKFDLELPIGQPNDPEDIPSSDLEGCGGFQNYDYFFTESGDGALVMKAPGDPAETGCIKYAESDHCRTELRETHPNSYWNPTASENRLTVELLGEAGSNICIGQVFQANSGNNKPFVELYYYSNGDLMAGVEYTSAGGSQDLNKVGNVPLGDKFTYEMRFENSELSVIINGGEEQTLQTYFTTPGAFFKCGNYNQGDDSGDIHVFNITIVHSD